MEFLQKLIDCLVRYSLQDPDTRAVDCNAFPVQQSLIFGESYPIKPSKIVAGHEFENTNVMLQLLAQAGTVWASIDADICALNTTRLDLTTAMAAGQIDVASVVQRTLAGEKPGIVDGDHRPVSC